MRRVAQEVRVAVVTGANRGIGEAVVRQLRAAGIRVVAAAREAGAGDTVLDVTCPSQIDALADTIGTGIDILVNNAAVLLEGTGSDIARQTMAVNFHGVLAVTDRLLPLMRKGGRIVMVSSDMGALSRVGPPLRDHLLGDSLTRDRLLELVASFVHRTATSAHARDGWPSDSYSASKVALNALTRVLAREVAGDPRGLTVNAASPGWVRTRMGGRGAPRSPDEGARTLVWLALSPDVTQTGAFFRDDRLIAW